MVRAIEATLGRMGAVSEVKDILSMVQKSQGQPPGMYKTL